MCTAATIWPKSKFSHNINSFPLSFTSYQWQQMPRRHIQNVQKKCCFTFQPSYDLEIYIKVMETGMKLTTGYHPTQFHRSCSYSAQENIFFSVCAKAGNTSIISLVKRYHYQQDLICVCNNPRKLELYQTRTFREKQFCVLVETHVPAATCFIAQRSLSASCIIHVVICRSHAHI